MSNDEFFNEALEQSEIKTAIVTKYFKAWAKVVIPRAKDKRIAYVDLFAGPGRYQDGTPSTPLIVLEHAIANESMRKMLVAMFNDVNSEHARRLKQTIRELPRIGEMAHPPRVFNQEVNADLVKKLEGGRWVPTLLFVDPWGYKGLSLELINSVLKDWGCDCIFFFNYNRINMGIPNPLVSQHMDSLFGEQRLNALREALKKKDPDERELAIVESVCEALRELGGRYILPFRFKHPTQGRTSHHLIFVSKHVTGYSIMKDIMARESSAAEQGVPTFEYNPAAAQQGLLFELARPLDELGDMLLSDFAGQTLTVENIYEQHHVGRRFVRKNYKDALIELEAQKRIEVCPPAKKRRKRHNKPTLADHVEITFPGGTF